MSPSGETSICRLPLKLCIAPGERCQLDASAPGGHGLGGYHTHPAGQRREGKGKPKDVRGSQDVEGETYQKNYGPMGPIVDDNHIISHGFEHVPVCKFSVEAIQ